MANVNLKELKYDNQLVLVEMARRALIAKKDINGNDIITTYATKAEIGQLKNLEPIFVNELPATGDPKYLYFVPKSGSAAGDEYNEYIWVTSSSTYELIGNSSIDISSKVDKLTTSGIHVYSHNGSTQTEIDVDTTSGGIGASNALITSGAVYAGLSGKQANSTILTSIAGVASNQTGLLKMTNGTASLDTNTYALASDLKITATDVIIDW